MEQHTASRQHDLQSPRPAQSRDVDTVVRFDIYVRIHKALRALMADVLTRVGQIDTDDPRSVSETLAAVRILLDTCRMHLEKENRFIHPAMEARMPGSTRAIAAEHVEHEKAYDLLEKDVHQIESAPPAMRAAAAALLYRHLTVFVGENLIHMDVEEAEHNRILWDTHADAEILALEQTIVASSTREQVGLILRWMVPHITPAERAALFIGMRKTAPAQVVDGALSAVKPHLDAPEWHKLMIALSS
jgi:iron-sulfur cluster repair protein YtfE (RIC family)